MALTVIDWMVVAAYMLGMLAVGWYYARRTRDADDDLLWVSYYSSHEGKTSIYLAKVKVKL